MVSNNKAPEINMQTKTVLSLRGKEFCSIFMHNLVVPEQFRPSTTINHFALYFKCKTSKSNIHWFMHFFKNLE